MKIGSISLQSNVFLCPLAGFTDLPCRLNIRPLGGLALAFTELVHPRGLKAANRRSVRLVQTNEEDRPLAIQLYGTQADELAEASKWAADRGSLTVDLNMGCPVPKVAGKGGGSGLLRSCDNAVRLVETIAKACPVPFTVKTRLGWEMGNLVAPRLARQLEEVGVAAITIHGRYGEQKFQGAVDLDGIAAVVDAVQTIPVIGNGDIHSPEDARHMVEYTGCAGVMIGRRALADPWIFRDTQALLTTGELPAPPTRAERTRRMIHHFELMIHYHGERSAVIEFRKWMGWYRRAIGPCPTLRRELPRLQSVPEFYSLVHEFLDELAAQDESFTAIGAAGGGEKRAFGDPALML